MTESSVHSQPPHESSNPMILQLRDGIKKAVVKGDFEIPTLPTVANEVLKLANDPNVGIADLEKIIRQDQAIAARVIKTANSTFYRGIQEVTSLGNAMSRIGLKAVKDIVISIGVQSKTFQLKGFEQILDRIWNHSTACAAIAQHISKIRNLNSDQAFIAGLLHDIGKPILVQIAHRLEQAELEKARNEAKKKFLKFDANSFVVPDLREKILPLAFEELHAVVGAAVAARWNLPALVVEVIKFHHDFTKAHEENRALVAVVQAANQICHYAGLGHDESKFVLSEDASLSTLNLTPDELQNLAEDSAELAHKMMGFV